MFIYSLRRFWDWLLPKTQERCLPNILRTATIDIAVPGPKKTETVDNPLFCYQFVKPFAPRQSRPGQYFDTWTGTYRWPTDDPTTPTEQYDYMDK
jgi:hypothetical protein